MKNKRILSVVLILCFVFTLCSCGKNKEDDVITLRVSNWEEYIDLGDWDEEETIELEDGTSIIGENDMVEDFEDWYYETYGKRVKVEYSTFGTNEDLYNQILMGDEFDLVCPSEYMIMKMHREGLLEPYSKDFFDTKKDNNYYSKGVSPYISDVFTRLIMENGESLSRFTAGYMWGTLGIVYHPEYMSHEDAKHWDILLNEKYKKRVTIKDSVRDAYFAAMGILNYDELMSTSGENYYEKISECLNRSDKKTVDEVEKILSRAKDNVYSFETDSGKADLVTGKIVANEQWSGDAVYTLDIAEEDGVELYYSAPEEGTNLWFDGWVMLKDSIGSSAEKKHAAEAFVNFLSRPDNAIRNMYYIGYTSVISGGDSEDIFNYCKYKYEAEEPEVDYPLGYFFTGIEDDKKYVVKASKNQTKRQLYSQYPPKDVVDRSVVMRCFSDEDNERINLMWINVRCFDFK